MQKIILHAGFCAHNRIIILEQDEQTCVFGILEENTALERKLKKAWPNLYLQFRIIEQDTFQVQLARLFSKTQDHSSENTENSNTGKNIDT